MRHLGKTYSFVINLDDGTIGYVEAKRRRFYKLRRCMASLVWKYRRKRMVNAVGKEIKRRNITPRIYPEGSIKPKLFVDK